MGEPYEELGYHTGRSRVKVKSFEARRRYSA